MIKDFEKFELIKSSIKCACHVIDFLNCILLNLPDLLNDIKAMWQPSSLNELQNYLLNSAQFATL